MIKNLLILLITFNCFSQGKIGFNAALSSQSSGLVNPVVSINLTELKSFPTAEGWGKFTGVGQTARTNRYVTNLNDSGSGSLREASTIANSNVLFKISGEITLLSTINLANNVQVLGQTAFVNDGEGITIRQNETFNTPLMTTSGHNVIRYIRFRRGKGLAEEGSGDNVQVNGNYHIFDHCSFSWGTDEQISNGAGGASYVTIQNSIISEGLFLASHTYSTDDESTEYQNGHSKGSLFGNFTLKTEKISFIRNLFAHNDDRNPSIRRGGLYEIVNNIFYNNRYANTILKTVEPTDPINANIIGNLYKAGLDTRTTRYEISSEEGTINNIYLNGNIGWNKTSLGSGNEWDIVGNSSTKIANDGQSLSSFESQYSYSDLISATTLESELLDKVGSNIKKDDIDTRVILDVINETPTTPLLMSDYSTTTASYTGAETYYGIINDPLDVGGWQLFTPTTINITDTDVNFIPDNYTQPSINNTAGYSSLQIYLADIANDFKY
ncbi:pectate lyase [Cellulophaga phage phi10:1]|uniref:Pectate lyase n=1 Tax=Cellulophaga phage phi10:1 TaxID=1327981 RepID=S0A0V0_9CAUD|nr:pectate lyase [Cellulophaga phage phi10:1]AGO48435.1 pectate lyase [Cellulophaga phage phi10:1]